jgi:ABC-2 type transport system permease protein
MSVSLNRIALVARRDYTTVITSRSFLVGLLVMPVMIMVITALVPRVLGAHGPQVMGEVALIDTTGKVEPELRRTLTPADIVARRELDAGQNPSPVSGLAVRAAAVAGGPPIPKLDLLPLPPDTDVQDRKSWLVQPRNASPRHLAIVVVQPDAVARRADAAHFGSFDLYTSMHIDDATESALRNSVRAALIAARLRSSGQDPAAVAIVQQVVQPDSVVVEAKGEHSGSRGIARFLPLACGVLIFIGVFTGGQILMTSTVEEKSNRVIEVLLAAVSPLELMYGKLLGGLGLGLTLTAAYIVMALYGLAQFSLAGLLDPVLIIYLLAFFVVTYLVFGSLMLTIGSAVNQMADAQALLGPVMILMVAGYVVSPVVGQAPNSSLSVALSFIPPVNTFAMLARVASSTPPPAWQVATTLLIGCLTAALVVWFAAKVFKVALLMHGKPPSFATLVRWARMA